MKKKFKYIFILLIIVMLGLIGFISWFLIGNDAPVIHGKVIWEQEYKENLKLDVYLPTKVVHEKTPVILFIHGGAWIGGWKEAVNQNRFNSAFNRLREKGYAIVSPAYTLAKRDHSPFPDCIQDAFDAQRWIEENAANYNFDLKNIGVMGESAGGHMAMMVAFANAGDFNTIPAKQIHLKYLIDIYGPADLEELYQLPLLDSIKHYLDCLPKGIEERLDLPRYLFGFDPEADTLRRHAYTKKYSPINYLNRSAPPTLLIHGSADQLVQVDQSLHLKMKLDSLKIENEIHIVEGANHGFIGATKSQKADIQNWIFEFIIEHSSPSTLK